MSPFPVTCSAIDAERSCLKGENIQSRNLEQVKPFTMVMGFVPVEVHVSTSLVFPLATSLQRNLYFYRQSFSSRSPLSSTSNALISDSTFCLYTIYVAFLAPRLSVPAVAFHEQVAGTDFSLFLLHVIVPYALPALVPASTLCSFH